MRKHVAPTLSPYTITGLQAQFALERSLTGNPSLDYLVENILSELVYKQASFTAFNVTQLVRTVYPFVSAPHYPLQGHSLGIRDLVRSIMDNVYYNTYSAIDERTTDGHDVLLYVPCLPKDRPHRKMDDDELDHLYNPWRYTNHTNHISNLVSSVG